jgi:hypothetical protein
LRRRNQKKLKRQQGKRKRKIIKDKYFNTSIYMNSDINRNQKDNIITPERYIFWLDDITVLYRNNQYIRFLPTKDMTRIEQLNALTRFFIYLIFLFLFFNKMDEWMYIPIAGIILCIILYNIFEIDEKGKRDELIRIKRKTVNDRLKSEQPEINYRTYLVDDDGDIRVVDIDADEKKRYMETFDGSGTPKHTLGTAYDIEAGYYDSDGKLKTGSYNQAVGNDADPDRIKYTLDEMRTFENATCRKPTSDNPFMNPSVDDFNKESTPIACNSDDADLAKDIQLKFNGDLYRDIEDVFDKKNSQRQFYTIAHNIPNDQEAFARWCYKFPATCKVDQERCLRYEDLRTKY